jgi:UPF0271 protein
MLHVDLNCDVGEGGPNDAALIQVATSVSIACGVHAGDPTLMRQTVTLAAARGVAIGAHPGYPDREGMGRRELGLAPAQVADLVTYQIGALAGFVRAAGVPLQHVKLHGALYNTAAEASPIAAAAAEAIAAADPALILVGLPGSEHERAAAAAGLRFAAEVFADRSYGADGRLTPRAAAGAFIHDPDQAARRVLAMVCDGRLETTAGTVLPVRAETVCVHGDNPAALAFARALAARLHAAGLSLRPLAGGR